MACTFSTAQLLKVLRSWRVLYILTWKCASRHNGVHFFISHLARWLRTRRFSEPTFRPSGTTNHWKNRVNCDFSTFSRTCIFFLLTLSLLWSSRFFLSSLTIPTSACPSVHLWEIWLLNFLRLFDMCILTYEHGVFGVWQKETQINLSSNIWRREYGHSAFAGAFWPQAATCLWAKQAFWQSNQAVICCIPSGSLR